MRWHLPEVNSRILYTSLKSMHKMLSEKCFARLFCGMKKKWIYYTYTQYVYRMEIMKFSVFSSAVFFSVQFSGNIIFVLCRFLYFLHSVFTLIYFEMILLHNQVLIFAKHAIYDYIIQNNIYVKMWISRIHIHATLFQQPYK